MRTLAKLLCKSGLTALLLGGPLAFAVQPAGGSGGGQSGGGESGARPEIRGADNA
jgi:hypothetical protein